jgi:hypothetical protein
MTDSTKSKHKRKLTLAQRAMALRAQAAQIHEFLAARRLTGNVVALRPRRRVR